MIERNQRQPLYLFTAMLAMVLLNGCATLDENECRSADWRLIGYEDGAAGRSPLRISEHREACAEVGVTPDLDVYRQGHAEGLQHYCRPATAFALGKRGRSFPQLCSGDGDSGLRQAYRDGKRVRALSQSVQQAQNQLNEHRDALKQVQQTMASHQAEIISRGTQPHRRKQLLAELVELSKEEERLPEEIEVLESELQARKRLLRKLESKLQY
jgi:hypothetical protein